MKVVIAAGGRFHAIRLAQELRKRNALYQLISGAFSENDAQALEKNFVTRINSCQVFDKIVWKTRLARVINPSHLYVIKDNWFDFRLKKIISNLEPFDIFTGWAHYFLGSINEIKQKAKIIITESGSCHIEEHEQLILNEYIKLNLPVNHINNANRTKILKEYQESDFIVTPSTFARQSFLKKGFSPNKILQIPCGMEIDFFSQKSSSVRTSNFFRLLFVGQLQIGKGIHILLEAWKTLKINPGKGELLLVGHLQKDVRLFLQKKGLPPGVRIIPGISQQHLKKIYQDSNAFVLPSIQDGFGMVIGEAMASGLPVIATTHTGAPDIITHEKEGLIIPPMNVEALAQAINTLYTDQALRESLGLAGIERSKMFTWQHYGSMVIQIYKNILEQKNAPIKPNKSSPYWEIQP